MHLDIIQNSDFVGHNCRIVRYNTNSIAAVAIKDRTQVGIAVHYLEAAPCKYIVKIVSDSQYQLYWYGTYVGASKIYLKNGVNVFIMQISTYQKFLFTVGIFSDILPIGKGFNIIDFTISKITDDNLTLNKKTNHNFDIKYRIDNMKKNVGKNILENYSGQKTKIQHQPWNNFTNKLFKHLTQNVTHLKTCYPSQSPIFRQNKDQIRNETQTRQIKDLIRNGTQIKDKSRNLIISQNNTHLLSTDLSSIDTQLVYKNVNKGTNNTTLQYRKLYMPTRQIKNQSRNLIISQNDTNLLSTDLSSIDTQLVYKNVNKGTNNITLQYRKLYPPNSWNNIGYSYQLLNGTFCKNIIQRVDRKNDGINLRNNVSTNFGKSIIKGKKNILLVIDTMGWCFDNITKVIKKYYGNKYNIYIETTLSNTNYLKKYGKMFFDLIVKFWYGYEKMDPFIVYQNAIRVFCIYDYIHWNKNISQSLDNKLVKNFVSNLKNSNYILYSCPIILTLLKEQYATLLEGKVILPSYDGVDIDKFYFRENNNNSKKLIVGWVGDTTNPYKKYHIIADIVRDIDWIEFKTQDKKHYIKHDAMVEFYHGIDVIVCLSEAEGTPNPILEASSCGRPWISTNVGIVKLLYDSCDEMVKPGFIIGGPDELLPLLEYLYHNRDTMCQMGKMARKYVEKEFSWDLRVRTFGYIFHCLDDKNNNVSLIKHTEGSLNYKSTNFDISPCNIVVEKNKMNMDTLMDHISDIPVHNVINIGIRDNEILGSTLTNYMIPNNNTINIEMKDNSTHSNKDPSQIDHATTDYNISDIRIGNGKLHTNTNLTDYNRNTLDYKLIKDNKTCTDNIIEKNINDCNQLNRYTESIHDNKTCTDNIIEKNINDCNQLNRYTESIHDNKTCTDNIIEKNINDCNQLDRYTESIHDNKTLNIGNNTNEFPYSCQLDDIIMINDTRTNVPHKVVITSTQYPRYGGAATCAYELHRYFVNNNYQSVCIFFDNKSYNNVNLLNPDNLPNVLGAKITNNYQNFNKINYYSIKNMVINIHGEEPYSIYALNYFAPLVSKYIFSRSNVYYLVTGCSYLNNDYIVDTLTVINNPINICRVNCTEKKTLLLSDRIVPNSQLTKNILEHCYKKYLDNIVDMHEIFKINESIPNDVNREIDIIFICSNYNRRIKNVELVKSIYLNNELKKYKKVCIGKESEKHIGSNEEQNIFCLDFMNKEGIISFLSKSRIVLVTSYIESYSITAIEAVQCGCIVLANRNTACSETMNKFFVMDSYDTNEWAKRIESILNNYHYFSSIFFHHFDKTPPIENLWKYPKKSYFGRKINIVITSIDIPYVGGAATNSYRLINCLSERNIGNVYGIYISNIEKSNTSVFQQNIFYIPYDKNIEDNIQNLCNKIIMDVGSIDIIFCKNYKLVPFYRKFINQNGMRRKIKLVFSPSGLRRISSLAETIYAIDIMNDDAKLYEQYSNIYFKYSGNIFKFVKDNDINLDYYAIKQSDIVIPNSLLTYELIVKMYSNLPNIKYPIILSNIILDNIPEDQLSSRPFDLLFCSYNWNRKCKNLDMVTKIISNDILKDNKIIIVGKKNKIKELGNKVVVYEYLENNSLMELLKKVKTVVIPSRYDSGPNILTEAIACGCNVVTSKNVGNYETLDPKCIVEKYYDPNEWVKVIINSLNNRYSYYGQHKEDVISDLERIFDSELSKRKSVGIYKIPPELNEKVNNNLVQPFFFDFVETNDTNFAYQIINYDIYFTLLVEISSKEKCTDVNYITYDPSIEKNVFVYAHKLYPTYSNNIKIWKIKDLESFAYFNDADIYFIRGTYYNFFKALIPSTAKTILYPATSIKQLVDMEKYHYVTEQKFDIILCHENNIYRKIYRSDKFVVFKKFAPDKFVCHDVEREYDICFVATEKQTTKNHDLFLSFVEYLENIGRVSKIYYVGNLHTILTKYSYDKMKLTNVTLFHSDKCTSEEMIDIYNRSKINILFSGRDAYPRVICESAACGCFNIALDTLSDGKLFYDGYLGVLIGDENVKKIIKPSGSLSYLPDVRLWEKIVNYMDMVFDHNNISIKFKKLYNIQNTINDIYQ